MYPPSRDLRSRHELFGYFNDRLGVEHEIVALEKSSDACLVNLHLEAANPERAKGHHAVALDAIVARFDAFDSNRWNGIDVCDYAKTRSPHPCAARHELDTRWTGIQQKINALQRRRHGCTGGHGDRTYAGPEARRHPLGGCLTHLRSRGDRHVST